MKKTLLLSVVASTMIMAGGDIAPVEPVVAAPVEAAAWNFEGQGVLYYQTTDAHGLADLFDQESSKANAGISLKASNADLIAGIGAGVKVVGLGTLGLDEDVVSGVMQYAEGGELNSGAVTEAYLTYTADSIKSTWKIGRQTLPQSLSPFAFSENWNVFQNTFEAALMVNTYFTDTAIVVAHVTGSNSHGILFPGIAGGLVTGGGLGNFEDISDDGVTMLTLQNKSFEGVTLTGTYYLASSFINDSDDVDMVWGDAKFALSSFDIALQGGSVMFDTNGLDDTTAFGAKVGTKLSMFDLSLAYSTVDDGDAMIHNYGTGVKTPLYTQMLSNEEAIKNDSDTFVFRAGMEALGGNFDLAYDYSEVGADDDEYTELDLTYSTNVGENVTLFAAYIYQNIDGLSDEEPLLDDDSNTLRFWARYNF